MLLKTFLYVSLTTSDNIQSPHMIHQLIHCNIPLELCHSTQSLGPWHTDAVEHTMYTTLTTAIKPWLTSCCGKRLLITAYSAIKGIGLHFCTRQRMRLKLTTFVPTTLMPNYVQFLALTSFAWVLSLSAVVSIVCLRLLDCVCVANVNVTRTSGFITWIKK